MMGQHARLGCSNTRWPVCPGSIRMEEMYPDIPGDAAIDGTGSHLLLEECVKQGVKAAYFIGQVLGEGHEDRSVGWEIDAERAARVQMCLDYLDRRVNELGSIITKVNSETQMHPGLYFGRDDWWGTCDLSLETPDVLEAIDYKDGRSWVDCESSQLVSYAAGLLAPYVCKPNPNSPTGFEVDLDFEGAPKTVRLTIVQPRTNPVVRYKDLPAAEVWARAAKLAEAAARTDDPDAPLIPDAKGGKGHCRWCKHRDGCDALARAKTEEGAAALQQLTEGDNVDIFERLQQGTLTVSELSGDDLASALDSVAAIQTLCDMINQEGEKRATETPGSVPGYGMGEGRKSRAWRYDEETTSKKLKNMRLKKDEYTETKLKSFTKIEKLETLTDKQRERLASELIETKPGKPKLVKVKKDVVSFEDEARAAAQPADSIPDFF